jgi:hypothetical protein
VPEPQEVLGGGPRTAHVISLDRRRLLAGRVLHQHHRQAALQDGVEHGIILRQAVDHEPINRRLADRSPIPRLP